MTAELKPVDLSLTAMKEVGAEWLVDVFEYIADNPKFVVNGFIKAGISEALDAGSIESETETEALTDDGMDLDSFSDVEDSDREEVDVDSD